MAQQALPVGLQCSMWSPFSLPFLLSRIGLAISVSVFPISDAVHCNPSCSALRPPLQCTASALAVHCIRPRTYLQPSSHVLATVLARTCGKRSFSAVQKSFPFILDWIPLREPPSVLERAVGVRLYLLISCGSVVGPSTISLPLSSMRMRSISTTRSSGLLFMRPW